MNITKRKISVAAVLGVLLGIWIIDSLFNYGSTVENFKKGYESVRNARP